eukprot:m.107235 g.107235  ORF g.107235 m.107235 type:complete len:1313 (+) comp13919_c0_seq1:97-4035(+)
MSLPPGDSEAIGLQPKRSLNKNRSDLVALKPATMSLFTKKEVGVGDMVLLEEITEDAILDNINKRLTNSDIYTYIGPVVVSVNPYKKLDIYSNEVIDSYYGRNRYEMAPHIYALTETAYRDLKDQNLDQVVIITGESGAGKTEASKVIMQYIARVCGKGAEVDRVKDQLLKSNPVLEAFGNAKTTRNNNSSRFGKYMDMQFDFKGDPVGGIITDYLLEKSRVVSPGEGERSFHIFYQLLAGSDNSLLSELKLTRKPEDYSYLDMSGCTSVDGIDDKEGWEEVMQALEVVNITKKEQSEIWKLLAIINHFGNIEFEDVATSFGSHGGSEIANDITELCELLGTDEDTMSNVFTTRMVNAGFEMVSKQLPVQDALGAVSAACKNIYNRLFTWIVKRINQTISVKNRRAKKKTIGVLDIYGFEILNNNSFEQFIINYCNEKLQQIFIELTLKSEQDEYDREGIPWEHIDYFDNSVICTLIEAKGGMLAILDDHCLRPEGRTTDELFLEQLNEDSKIMGHKHFETRRKRGFETDRDMRFDDFRLVHYAGAVVYDVNGFIKKNKDTLYVDISRFLYSCNVSILRELFKDGKVMGQKASTGKRPVTLGSQFKTNVAELMKNLSSKTPHYIRCVKPNSKKTSLNFDRELTRHQVRYLGLLENIKVRRAGYAFRMEYPKFLDRYKMLCGVTWPVWKGSPRDGVKHLLNEIDLSKAEYSWGRSKIFIRSPKTLFLIEDLRKEAVIKLVIKMQARWRGFLKRRDFLELRGASNLIAAWFKGYKRRKKYKATKDGAMLITSFFRMWRERRKFEEHKQKIIMRKAGFVITAWARGFYTRSIRATVNGKVIEGGTNKLFQRNAGPLLARNLIVFQKIQWLSRTSKTLPPSSPIDRFSIEAPPAMSQAGQLLQVFWNEWRCRNYRNQCSPAMQAIFREKVIASQIFRGQKSSYPASIKELFKGDQIILKAEPQASKWAKIVALTGHGSGSDVLVATQVMKVHRSNGTEVERVFVLTTGSFIVCDMKYRLKYIVLLDEIQKVSCSQQNDGYFVLHVDVGTEKGRNKGDHMFRSVDLIEILTRLYIAHNKKTGRKLNVEVSDNFDVRFDKRTPFHVSFARSDKGEQSVKRKRRDIAVELPSELVAPAGAAARGGEKRQAVDPVMRDLHRDRVPTVSSPVRLPRTTSGPVMQVRNVSENSVSAVDEPQPAAIPKRMSEPVMPSSVEPRQRPKSAIVSSSRPEPETDEEPTTAAAGRGRGGRGRGRGRGSRGRGRGRGGRASPEGDGGSASTASSGSGRGRGGRGSRGRGRGGRSRGRGRGGRGAPSAAQ